MTSHHDPHMCPHCGLCTCGCDDCHPRSLLPYCTCPDCECENIEHDHDACATRKFLEMYAQTLPEPMSELVRESLALDAQLTRRRYKYAPAFTPHTGPANVSPYWHGPQPAVMICYSDPVLDTLMQRPDRYAWLAQYLERYGGSHPKPSPRAYALAHGLRGAAADMFAEIATAIQEAKCTIPW
jgi:hypothetical protein